jgi:hypothetical protein
MASIIPINPEEPQVEIVEGLLHVREAAFGGAIVQVGEDLGVADDPAKLLRVLTDAVDVGATVLRNGQNRALVENLALEIDRLVSTTTDETERLPEALQKPLGEHLQTLSDLLAENFDPKRARSLQRQLPTIVGEATAGELRRLVEETLSESGAVGAELKLFSSSNTETLTRVNTLLGRIEHKLGLDEQIERSVHKGRPFEEIVRAELEAIHGPLGDEVRCVRAEYGLLPTRSKGAKAGDYVVILNPEHTRGREISFAVEAKTGPLNAAAAQRELETAIRNRGSVAGVLVFDGLEDAPLGGRCYLPHGDGRFTAVLDLEDGLPLAFEVACREARLVALRAVQAEGKLDPSWVQAHCNRLSEAVEDASAMLRSLNGIERGAKEARGFYTQMRERVLELLDELRERAE